MYLIVVYFLLREIAEHYVHNATTRIFYYVWAILSQFSSYDPAHTLKVVPHSVSQYPRFMRRPVQTLHTRYPVGIWQKAFVEGISTGHPSMPQFSSPRPD